MSISSVFSRPRGNLVPTGLPIEAANEAERLALIVEEGSFSKQLDTGMTWKNNGGTDWLPAPGLGLDLDPDKVLSGNYFQSANYPTLTQGTLVKGLPIQVANEAERLELTLSAVDEMRVTEMDTGIVYVYHSSEWYPAPLLSANAGSGEVLVGIQFQSKNYPLGSTGTYVPITVSDTRILPAQAWADNIGQFLGVPSSQAINFEWQDVTFIDPKLLVDRYNQISLAALGQPFIGCTNCNLTNCKEIVSAMNSAYIPLTGLLMDLTYGSNSKISPIDTSLVSLRFNGATVDVNYTACIAPKYSSTKGWAASGSGGAFGIATGDENGMFHEAPNEITSLTVDSSSEAISPTNLNLESLTSLTELHFNGVVGIASISNIPSSLDVFEFTACSGFGPAGLDFSNKSVSNIDVHNTAVTTLDVTGCSLLGIVNVSGCNFDESSLDYSISTLLTLAQNGSTGGILDISNQSLSATPSSSGLSMLADLQTTYGWSITQ